MKPGGHGQSMRDPYGLRLLTLLGYVLDAEIDKCSLL